MSESNNFYKNNEQETNSIPNTFSNFVSLLRKKIIILLDDPIGYKKREWERYDNWVKEIKYLAENKINRRFLCDNSTYPSCNRTKSTM